MAGDHKVGQKKRRKVNRGHAEDDRFPAPEKEMGSDLKVVRPKFRTTPKSRATLTQGFRSVRQR